MPAIISIIFVMASMSSSEEHSFSKQAPYFFWNFLSFIIASIFAAVATSAQSLIFASLTASLTASGNSAISASSTSCFMFPSSSIHPIALSKHSSVFISSMAEALISSIEGQDASQLLKSEGLEGFLEFLDLFCFLPFLEGLVGFFSLLDFLDPLVFLVVFFPLKTFFFLPLSEGSSKSKALPELRSLVSGAIDVSCISSIVAAIISGGTRCLR